MAYGIVNVPGLSPDESGIQEMSVGTVTTAPAGNSASAEIVKSGTSAVLNLTIPKGDAGAQGSRGYTGSPGADGTSVSITGTSVTYAVSSSGTTIPTSWSTSIPTASAGQYFWTKTVVNYSTGQSTTSYSVARNGTDGSSGAATSLATQTSNGLMSASDKTKTDSFTVYDGFISAKGFKTTTDSGNRHVELGPQDVLSLYTAKNGGSAAGLTYRDHEGTSLGSYGAYTENGLLKFYYIGRYASPLVKVTLDGDLQANTFNGKTLDNATASSDGMMSASDKSKLDGIELSANRMIVDEVLSETSTNPVQNKAVYAKINLVEKNLNEKIVPLQSSCAYLETMTAGKVTQVAGKGLSTNDFTDAEKSKLASIDEGARAVVVDTSLNASSAHPVANAEITRQFKSTNDAVAGLSNSLQSVSGAASAAKTKTDSFTVENGMISTKGVKTTTDSGNKHVEVGPQGGLYIYIRQKPEVRRRVFRSKTATALRWARLDATPAIRYCNIITSVRTVRRW